MSEGNAIYEITKMMSSEQNLKNDFQEAVELIRNMFHEKYIYKLEKELKRQREIIQKSPSREIRLISALKPFVEEKGREDVDKIINLMINADTISAIQKSFLTENNKITAQSAVNLKKESNQKKDPSIKEDGIYDIDESCLMSMQNSTGRGNNIFPLFLILFMMFLNH